MTLYSEGFRNRMIEKLSGPNPKSATGSGAAFRQAFTAKSALSDAISVRDDAINVGSAGEIDFHGRKLKKLFRNLPFQLRITDEIAVDAPIAGAGWAAANVQVYRENNGTTIKQTFRVLLGFVAEPEGWRVVVSHCSNAGPIWPDL